MQTNCDLYRSSLRIGYEKKREEGVPRCLLRFEYFFLLREEPCFPTVLSIEMKNGINDFMGPVSLMIAACSIFSDCLSDRCYRGSLVPSPPNQQQKAKWIQKKLENHPSPLGILLFDLHKSAHQGFLIPVGSETGSLTRPVILMSACHG